MKKGKVTYKGEPLVRKALLDESGQEQNNLLLNSDLRTRSDNNNILNLILPGLKDSKARVMAQSQEVSTRDGGSTATKELDVVDVEWKPVARGKTEKWISEACDSERKMGDGAEEGLV